MLIGFVEWDKVVWNVYYHFQYIFPFEGDTQGSKITIELLNVPHASTNRAQGFTEAYNDIAYTFKDRVNSHTKTIFPTINAITSP